MTVETDRTTWPAANRFYDFSPAANPLARMRLQNLLLVLSVQKRNGLTAG